MRTLPLLDELEAALASGNIARRVDILSRITDLFVHGAEHYSEDQVNVFDDVMARLVNTIETKARAKLAVRLAPIPNAPSGVIHMLAFDDDIEVARPVLAQSERLDERDLLVSAGTKSQQSPVRHRAAQVAERGGHRRPGRTRRPRRRAFGGEEFRRAVFRRRLPHAGQALDRRRRARHRGGDAARYSAAAFPHAAGKGVERSARATVRRKSAGRHRRRRAWSPRWSAASAPKCCNTSPDFAAAQAAVERQNRIRRIGESEIYQYARDRKFEETAIALSIMCDTPIDVVERALLDPGAEIVLILAKVAGLSATTTKAVLLLRAADRGMSAKDLDHALASFNRLHADTAKRVLSFFRTRVKKPDLVAAPAVAVSG